MQFQVRTDNHITNSEALTGRIRAEVEGALYPRFADQLRRIEVYLEDLNAQKGGVDTRCTIEARLAGLRPAAVENRAENLDEAVSGAVDKLLRVLEHTVDRLGDRNGRSSMSGEAT